MTDIDIKDYIDRWAINYIVYHKEHLIKYGDPSEAFTYFNQKYYEEIANSFGGGTKVFNISDAKYNKQKAVGVLLVLDQLQKGTLLDEIMDSIATGINQGLEISSGNVNWDNYESIIQEAKGFSNLFNDTENFSGRFNQFFSLILQAMDQAKLLSLEVLNGLTKIGQKLGGTSFSMPETWNTKVIPISEQDKLIADKVISSLNNAANKVSANTMTPRSFATTINYIFTKVIGNKLYNLIMANGLAAAQSECDSLFNQMVHDGKLKWINKSNTKPSSGGRANIISSQPLSIAAMQNGQEYEIEIANFTDVRWTSRAMEKGVINIIGKSSIADMFNGGQPEKYLAYNMIAHRGVGAEFDAAYDRIRAYTAASFFKEWIKGEHFRTSSGKKAQFLMIKGKVYSVQRIINNICNEIMMNGAENVVKISGVRKQENKWIGTKANIDNAIIRSDKVNAIIDTLTIAVTLNPNILDRYAH